MFLLDTNARVTHLRTRGRSRGSQQLRATPLGDPVTCRIVRGELVTGALKGPNPAANVAHLHALLDPLISFPFTDGAADVYGRIGADLERKGTPIGGHDYVIAAIALVWGSTLVTHNTGEFSRFGERCSKTGISAVFGAAVTDPKPMPLTPLRHAVLPAAGFGTRMLPAARAVPKELLPILDRPTVQYVVEEAAAGGITEVTLVTSPLKPALLAHFENDPDDPLRRRLNAAGKSGLLRSIDELLARVRIGAVMQHEQRGLGDAVLAAREAVGGEPFACLLADTVFAGDGLPTAQLAAAYRRLGTAVIGLERVAPEKVGRYGIVGGTDQGDGTIRIETLVEKPQPQQAPSDLAIAARYVLTPGIFDCLSVVTPGVGGEVQLTDGLRLLCQREPVHGVILTARRHDIGNLVDWLSANLAFAAADPALWAQLRPLIGSLPSAQTVGNTTTG